MNVSNIAHTTVNTIVKEVFESYNKGICFTKKKIKKKLQEDKVSDEKIEDLLDLMGQSDPFQKAREQLLNESRRKQFINGSFPSVQPETVQLSGKDSLTKDTYQYVPIEDSLRVLLEDETYILQKIEDPYHYDPDVIKDVRDGDCFRQNEFFQEHPEAVPLIVFSDELEVCNPLGAGKTKHKINCTYFSSLHIQPALRSKVQSVQLVSLVLSRVWKKYGNQLCYDRFVVDMKKLEDEGLEINLPVKETVHVGLAFIIGDNLGQHNLAEMSQSFSSGYICRWCKASYDEVCRRGLCYDGIEGDFHPNEWTVPEYDSTAQKAEDEGGGSVETFGIKGKCVFNKLKSFHCVLQMPPCLGHDFYEGCFALDMQFYLDYLINTEKLISEEEFNQKLKNISLSARDSNNRPKPFKTRRPKKNTKYEGNAGSLRVLGRIVPMLLSSELDGSQVGNLIIKLEEVSELITAPKLTRYEIDNILHFTIIEYLDLRVEGIETFGMDTIKPKHHFLSHYSKLYKFHGPLIHLWAMRMEAKHTFFKNCIRTSKNFINPAKTCATRHQMAQISYCYLGLFPRKFEIPVDAVSVKDLMTITKDVSLKIFFSSISQEALIPKTIKIFGTVYETGMVLVVEKRDLGEIKVGILQAISFYREKVTFGCTVFEALLSKHGYFVSSKKVSDMETFKLGSLPDHHPLQRVGTASKFCFSLHHYVSQPVRGPPARLLEA